MYSFFVNKRTSVSGCGNRESGASLFSTNGPNYPLAPFKIFHRRGADLPAGRQGRKAGAEIKRIFGQFFYLIRINQFLRKICFNFSFLNIFCPVVPMAMIRSPIFASMEQVNSLSRIFNTVAVKIIRSPTKAGLL